LALAKRGYSGVAAEGPRQTNAKLYGEDDPLAQPGFSEKVALLQEIDAFARGRDPRVAQVLASLAGERRVVEILRADGRLIRDVRPLVRVNVSITVEKDGRRESGMSGAGGRASFEAWITPEKWQDQVDEALRQALVNLEAVPCPAGEMDVVLGAGWNGVLLHEAVGHGLEGDFNRKGISAFSGRVGERVAAPGVTVFDDGSLPGRRGSLTVDDEGTPTERTVLIEDGVLVGYMHDRQSARLMGLTPTGNARRQSFAHMPMPRMTNTGMAGGSDKLEDMIASTKRGLFCATLGGGQVDIVNGKFVFQCTEAYLIEDGKVTAPVKGATLIGDGPSALTRVTMIGDDFSFDPGIGVCGKNGQGVPVGVGQPSLKITGLTVGGTKV
jgi:TldD protein